MNKTMVNPALRNGASLNPIAMRMKMVSVSTTAIRIIGNREVIRLGWFTYRTSLLLSLCTRTSFDPPLE